MKTYGVNRHRLDRHTGRRQVLWSILFLAAVIVVALTLMASTT